MLLRLAERQPRNVQAQFLLGRLAIETESWDEAIARLSGAVELDPDHDGAWTALGYVYESQRRTDEAIDVYRRAVKSNPDNPAFVERLGDLLIRLGRFKEAQAEVEALAELAPRDPRVWMKLGAVFYEQKMWDKAGDAFRRVVAARAHEPPGPLLPGHDLHGRRPGRRGQGRAGEDPARRSPLDRRAGAAGLPLGQGQEATTRPSRLLREAVNIDPKRPELFLYLGTAYFRAKEYDRAAQTLQEGLTLDEKQKELHFQLGVVFEKQQKFEDAVAAVPPRHHARSQARRGLQLRRLHVRRARPEPRRGRRR